MPEQFSLSGISKGEAAEIVEFLDGHIAALLQLLVRAEEISEDEESESRGTLGGTGRFGRQLELLTQQTMGRFQTPQCVSFPKILPAPNLYIAYTRLHELRAQRGAILNQINWGTRKGSPEVIRSMGENLFRAIYAARIILENIHSTRIAFSGEREPTTTNLVNGGQHGNIVQVGEAKEVHVHQQDSEDNFDPKKLIIATVDIVPGAYHSDLVVDSDPPYAITPSGSIYVITLEARTKRAIVLQAARPIVTRRRKPRRVCISTHITGAMTSRRFNTDLDSERPVLTPEGATFPFTISSTDVEQFWIEPTVGADEVTWRLEIDWICAGQRGTAVLGGPGGTFEVYPMKAALSTKCDDDPFRHVQDCPASRLRSLDPNAPLSTFSSVRDTQNECWLSVIDTLGHI